MSNNVAQLELPVDYQGVSERSAYLPVGMPAFQEEVANTLTHGAGMLLSVAALVYLMEAATATGNALTVFGCAVYGVCQTLLYAASTLYHGVQQPRAKGIFRKVDHVCIYLLIAGTYTPFLLAFLDGPWLWSLLSLVWACALFGAYSRIVARPQDPMSYTPYIATGWLAVLAVKPIIENTPMGGLLLIFAGGVCFTIGVAFLLQHRRPYFHTIWHLWVLAGSTCHFFAVLDYVVPAGVVR
jgi:hemolysin III